MNILNKYFGKIFLITCPTTYKDRAKNIEHLKKIGLDFEIVVATDKNRFSDDIEQIHFKKGDLSLNSAYCSIFINSILNGYDKICTIEDDILLVDNYEEMFKEVMSTISDWDILHLGYTKHGLLVEDEIPLQNQDLENETRIFHHIVQNDHIVGTHIMGFKRKTFEYTLTQLLENYSDPIDWFLFKQVYYKFLSYTLRKKIFLAQSFRDYETDRGESYKVYESGIELSD